MRDFDEFFATRSIAGAHAAAIEPEPRARHRDWLRAAGALLLLLAQPAGAQVAIPHAEFVPTTAESQPLISQAEFVGQFGYVEEEFLLSGTTNIYDYVDNASQSPLVQVIDTDVPYTTRLLVRRPADATRFNGTVYLEIVNATRGYDSDVMFQYSGRMVMREGAIYVGMTSKGETVDFLRDKFGRPPYIPREFSRYATLSMENDGQVWDMLAQTAALLKTDTDASNPLAGLNVERVIMTGYSQSAGYIKTFVNSFHNDAIMADGRRAIDAYFEGAGSFASKVPNPANSADEFNPGGDPRNIILLPAPAPLMRFQTGTEVTTFFNSKSTRQTEADSPLLRTYEMAGGAHVDAHLLAFEIEQNLAELGLVSAFPTCPNASSLHVEYALSALLSRLDDWLEYGRVPPPSRLLSLVPDDGGRLDIERDSDGNAIGGVRMPELSVPTGTWSGAISGFECFLNGTYVRFSDEELAARYPWHSRYVAKTFRAVRRAHREGFLLPADGWAIIVEAYLADIGQRPPRRWWQWWR